MPTTLPAPNTSRPLLLHGGGFDSTSVFLWLTTAGQPFDCMAIDYGHIAADAELAAIYAQCGKYQVPLRVVNSDLIGRANAGISSLLFTGNLADDPIVEGRNLLLVTEAVLAGYSTIYLGIDKPHTGVAWPDASKDFLAALNTVLNLSFNRREIQVIAPFIDVDKTEVYRTALAQDQDFWQMAMSCWAPVNNKPCGVCKHCVIKPSYKESCK